MAQDEVNCPLGAGPSDRDCRTLNPRGGGPEAPKIALERGPRRRGEWSHKVTAPLGTQRAGVTAQGASVARGRPGAFQNVLLALPTS